MRMSAPVALLAGLALVVTAPPAEAQSDWEFTIAPYLLAAGIDGDMTIAAFESEVDVPFDSIIDSLDMAFMGHFQMRNERWVILSDLFYVDLGDSVDVAEGTLTAGLKETLIEAAGGYRVSPALALLVGARWVGLSTDLKYSGPNVDERADASKSWVDPFVGAHLFAPLSDRWWIGLHGDIGGFGVGSDLAWQAYGDIGWRASKLVTLFVGYRAIDMDYEDGEGIDYFHYDLMIAGPQLGIGFTF